METSGLHRYSLAAAAFTLLLVITGAVVTSNQPGGHIPAAEQWFHQMVAGVVVLLTAGLAWRLSRVADRPAFPKLGWSALGLVVVQAVLPMLAPGAATLHAVLAQVFFGVTAAITVVTAPGWCAGEMVDDRMRPPLRTLANITLGMVLVQIILGASVRHKVIGALSHIGFAVLVALAAMVLGMCVLNQAPQHRTLRPAAINLMVMTGIQVFLGFGAFIMKLMMADTATGVVVVTVAHVTTAALTLGATVTLTLRIQRYFRAAAPEEASARPSVAS
ncbi:MAG: hypothetical protein JO336_00395 [Acidobacteriia bacterium]|nr:hypothetical protein [Terriglobia bacterium]MBV8905170.1 hypothetical protein [Terriglobia bacterium]MBV9745287.1 hypothetical protein [Terriglobia bacterium]